MHDVIWGLAIAAFGVLVLPRISRHYDYDFEEAT